MDTFLQYTIIGLVTGGVYGIAASGLVVTYTTSGIFNFAHGAVAMLAAFTYWQLRWGWGWPAPIALLVVLGVLAPLLGAALYGVVMRGLRNVSEVARIVVPVSVMLGFLALSTWVWDPTPRTPRLFPLFFGADKTVTVAGVNLAWHEIIAMVVAVLVAVGLRFLFTATRTGVAMRAVVDDPDLLELNGGKPERLAMASWALGAFLAALAGVLITPIQGSTMSATALTLLVIDAFAAAMFGRLRSVPRTFVGALVLGLAGSYVIGYFPGDEWTWVGNFRVSLPMIALFVVLLFLPQDRLRGRHRAAHPRALPHAQHAQRAHRCGGPGGRHVPGARPAGADLDQHARLRNDRVGHRPVARAAHRLRGRDQPGRALVRGDRGDRRPPLRGQRRRAGRPVDAARATCWRPSCARWSGRSWRSRRCACAACTSPCRRWRSACSCRT